MLIAAMAMAADRNAALLACRAVEDSGARLACFDREAAAMVATPVKPPAPAKDSQQQFGLPQQTVVQQEVAAGARAPDLKRVEAKVTTYRRQEGTRPVVSLDNGQTWQQLSPDDLMLKSGDGVVIARAALGSFWMQAGNGRGSKVTRLR